MCCIELFRPRCSSSCQTSLSQLGSESLFTTAPLETRFTAMKYVTALWVIGLCLLCSAVPAMTQTTEPAEWVECDQCEGDRFVVQRCEGCEGKKRVGCFECSRYGMGMARTRVAKNAIDQEIARGRGKLFLDELELEQRGTRAWNSKKSIGTKRCTASCNSKNKPKCKACKGANSVKCGACRGKRTGMCDLCQGEGKRKIACSACRATGYQSPIRRGTAKDFAQCLWCKGKAVQTCGTCKQTGKSKTQCRPCQGRGKRLCTSCNGQRPFGCGFCGGRGRGVPLSDMTGPVRKCKACNAKGVRKCKECKKGFQSCQACDGKGKGMLDCHQCHGKRQTPCLGCASGVSRSWEWEADRLIEQGENEQAAIALAAGIEHQQKYLLWFGESLRQKFPVAKSKGARSEKFYEYIYKLQEERITAMERRAQVDIGRLQARVDKLRR